MKVILGGEEKGAREPGGWGGMSNQVTLEQRGIDPGALL